MSAFRLPRLPQSVPLVDPKTGLPTIRFQRWWQSVVEAIEDAINGALAAQIAADLSFAGVNQLASTVDSQFNELALSPAASFNIGQAPNLTPPPGALTFSELGDVLTTSPAQNAVLVYDTGLWRDVDKLPVASGGTGAVTLTSGALLKGNGTSAVSASIVTDNGTGITVAGDALVNNAFYVGNTSFKFQLDAGVPTIIFAPGDLMTYDPTGDTYSFYIGNTLRARITAGTILLEQVRLIASGVTGVVEAGAVDSGGVGYRMLRIPN